MRDNDIAVVGLSCRFPGAPSPRDYWRLLREGLEGARALDDEALLARGVERRVFSRPDYVRVSADIPDIEWFDAAFFGCSPAEAELMDPQHRVFLETAWSALEDAGIDPSRFDGPIACFAGKTLNTYLAHAMRGEDAAMALLSLVGNDKDYLATQVAYKLDLRGPSVSVQTACSTSLVAIHQACQSLLNGECDAAVAGGVSIRLPYGVGYVHQPGMVFSPDGRCRAFDAAANGMLSGSGAGAVVLRRAADALAAGDPIRAIILGTAVNNDGARKVGFTAPSVDGQAAVIAEALAVADVEPETIAYIEAHGTGTPLGDPIEVAALTRALGHRDGPRRVSLGSVKTNFGHLDAAAGVAGFIKAVLALQHKELPPTLHFARPNPEIDFTTGGFDVQTALAEWPANGGPRRAGVSSFGIGGTNAHAVLQEAPAATPVIASARVHVLPLSARSEDALAARAADLDRHLGEHPSTSLDDVAWTLQTGRRSFELRRAIVAATVEEARAPLAAAAAGVTARPRSLVFMFPGQGAQYVGMARGLSAAYPFFREGLDACISLVNARLDTDLRAVLYGETPAAADVLRQTRYAQPALFAIEYALARLLTTWLGRPSALIGHSVGEYAAACLAGVFSLEDAVALVVERGRLMQAMPAGTMLAIGAPEAEVVRALDSSVELAAVNGPSQCVVSGRFDAIAALAARLTASGVVCHQLKTSHAFHSASMDAAAAAFAERVARVTRKAPEIPVISNVTAMPLTAADAEDPRYWARQLRTTVRFADGVRHLLESGDRLLLEAGPGSALHGLVRRHPAFGASHAALTTMRQEHETRADAERLLEAVGQAWVHGANVDWAELPGSERRRHVSLPTYPFVRQRYWREPEPSAAPRASTLDRIDLDVWFHVPGWKRVPPREAKPSATGRWLVFGDDGEPMVSVVRELRARGAIVTTVHAGDAFVRTDEQAFVISPGRRDHYDTLLAAVAGSGNAPLRVVHAWSVGDEAHDFDAVQDTGFFSLVWLAQALGRHAGGRDVRLVALSTGVFDVHGSDPLMPFRSTVIAPLRVIPQEYPGIRTRHVDIEPGRGSHRTLVDALIDDTSPSTLAIRGTYMWEQTFDRIALAPVPADGGVAALRPHGVYLVTGGLGDVGFGLSRCLARRAGARLAIVSRGGASANDRLDRIRELESCGAEVLVLQADVADEWQMRAAIAATKRRFGGLHGVIHAAGERLAASIDDTTREQCAAQFRAKIQGILTLEHVLAAESLDFCQIVSSLSSALGGIGLVAYTAAHVFMDTWVLQHNRLHPVPWRTVNWDNWLSDAGTDRFVPGLDIASGHRHADGVEAFERIVSHGGPPQVLVSTVDLEARIRRWADVAAPAADDGGGELPHALRYARPKLSTEFVTADTDLARTLAGLWQDLLQIDRVGIHDNFFELGGDSVVSIRFLARAARAGVRLTTRDVFERQTIAELCAVAVTTGATSPAAEQGIVTGDAPLTPMQQWFVEENLPQPSFFNQVIEYETPAALDVTHLHAALQAIVDHHDGLRLALVRSESGWRQRVLPPRHVPLRVFDLSRDADDRQRAAIAERIDELHRDLDLAAGDSFRFAYFDLGPRSGRLTLIVHHAAIDAFAWRVIAEDLETAYAQAVAGQPIALPEKTTSTLAWARDLETLARDTPPLEQLGFWARGDYGKAARLPRDAAGANTAGSADRIELSLDEPTTAALLSRVTRDHGTRLEILIQTALARALARFTGSSPVLFDCEGHGRDGLADGVDLSRTVAWCTAIYPSLIDLPGEATSNAEDWIAVTRDQLAAIPAKGAHYGLLRYLCEPAVAEQLRPSVSAEVLHCHLGQIEQPASAAFRPIQEQQLFARSAEDVRRWLIEADTLVYGGRLATIWRYSRNVHRRETIERVAQDFLDTLRSLANHDSTRRHRPSDFPQADLEQDELDELVAELSADEDES
jgi:non-ribosomal peptide synthase protein (TIGR01720 family)